MKRWVMLVAGLLALVILAMPSASPAAAVGVSIVIAPPALPVYVQPVCPGDGYIWTPGYWAYGTDGYYWVPGTWVLAPEPGLLWTPGYWGWSAGAYIWHVGYWGPVVGFYGGINYGFGYTGVGYAGGYWRGSHFFYNRTVNNVNVTVIHNVYSKTVVNNTNSSRVSFNGGRGGTTARPTRAEMAAARERHVASTHAQRQHEHEASTNRAQFASVNHGKPAIAATPKPAQFSGHDVVPAKAAGGRYVPAKMSTNSRAANLAGKKTSPAPTSEAARGNKAAPAEHPSTDRSKTKPFASPHTAASRTESKPSTSPKPAKTARPESKPVKPPAHKSASPSRIESHKEPQHQHVSPSPGEHAPRTSSQHESASRTETKPPKPPMHEAAPHSERKPESHDQKPSH
jgi:WXXGXW repeat (2 copies)